MPEWPVRSPELLALTFAAGALDALSYLRGHAFVANMTGNTVLLGLSVLGVERSRLVPCGIALGGFLAGAAIAALFLVRRTKPSDETTDLRYGIALELPLILVFCALWLLDASGILPCAPALLLSGGCALGIQSVAVRRMKISGVVTTFITGTMTAAVVEALAGPGAKEHSAGGPSLLVTMFLLYIAAAASGALLFHFLRIAACAAPLAAIALAGMRAWAR